MRFFDKWFGSAAKHESSPREPERYSARVAMQRVREVADTESLPVLVPDEDAQASNDDEAGYDPYNSGRFRKTVKY
jgi:hypothetical protein